VVPESESRFSRQFRTTEVVAELDLIDGIGQRSSSFTFELINGVTGAHKRFLTPYSTSPPSLSHDTTRTIKRQISNFNLGKEDTAAIVPATDRVLLAMIVGGKSYPLGGYVFTDFSRRVYSSGKLSNAILMDEMLIVDQELEHGFSPQLITNFNGSVSSVSLVENALRTVLQDLPITTSIAPSPFYTIGSWTIGTNRGSVVESLSVDGDYFSPWFSNERVMTFIRAFDPATATPDFDLDAGNSVFGDGIHEDDDILIAPNRYVVISNGGSAVASGVPAVGRYDVPNSAPYSILNRGFVIPQTHTIQLVDASQAQAVAQNIGLRNTIFERTTLRTAIDPRHDAYDVVFWQGENWLEIAWSFTCLPDAPMLHVLRKAYS
jgi:hypothetical protein